MWSVRWMRLGVFVAVLLLGFPTGAMAGWPLAGSVTVLGFGASYRAMDGATSTHRGLDIAGVAGEVVVAPLAGTVSFIGRVPGSSGGTVLAATLQTASGALTLLPLDSATVIRGDVLSQGEAIGTLAGEGDASAPVTHLHVGLRKGDLYVDPTDYLAPPAAPSEQLSPLPDGAGVVTDASPGIDLSRGIAVAGAGSGASASVGDAIGSGAEAEAGVATGFNVRAVTGARGAVSVAPGGLELAPGVTFAPAGTPMRAGTPAPAAMSVDGRLNAAMSAAVRSAQSGAKAMALLGVSVFCAVWVRSGRCGAPAARGKVRVRFLSVR